MRGFPQQRLPDQVDTLTQALDNLAIKRNAAFDFPLYVDLWKQEYHRRELAAYGVIVPPTDENGQPLPPSPAPPTEELPPGARRHGACISYTVTHSPKTFDPNIAYKEQ